MEMESMYVAQGPCHNEEGVKGQSMSERKAVGIDTPGLEPRERASEEKLVLLLNFKRLKGGDGPKFGLTHKDTT